MSNDSGPLVKRFCPSLGSNIQLTECIREFKLPRQYPSIASKLHNGNASVDRRKGQSFGKIVTSIPKVSIGPKIVPSKEADSTNKIRTIKLKAKDGRDLGELKVQHLAKNLKGKTITIAKNGIGRTNESALVVDEAKGITIGVLTPVNVLKTESSVHPQGETACNVVSVNEKNSAKAVVLPSDAPQVPAGSIPQGRPQVLVVRSGKSWHMVKIPSTSSAEPSQKNTKNRGAIETQRVANEGKNSLFLTTPFKDHHKKRIVTIGTDLRAEESTTPTSNSCTPNNTTRRSVKTWALLKASEGSTERCKQQSILIPDNGETVKPKMGISQSPVACSDKTALITPGTRNSTDKKCFALSDALTQKNTRIKQDVMVFLPPREEKNDTDTVVSPQTKTDYPRDNVAWGKKASNTSATDSQGVAGSAWKRKLLANKNNDATRYSSSRHLASSPRREKKDDMANNLIILEKALSSVEDEVLREKALKALAECGIGMERFVPLRPASEQKSVKDSNTQTSIFGLWESKRFIFVPKDVPTVERIPIIKKKIDERPYMPFLNPNSQDLLISGLEKSCRSDRKCDELKGMVEAFVGSSETANRVAAIFAEPCPIHHSVVQQLRYDFDNCKKYNKDGLLYIHKAVIMGHVQTVARHIMVLRACKESIDVPTRDGQTSLELAILHDVSPEIVKLLLDAGAEPTCTDRSHDSALIIASKQSSAMLMELVQYVKSYRSLNHYDSIGMAALHYCACNGYQEGLTVLIRASADVNLKDCRSGRTALFHAIENEHSVVAEILLKNGAEANIPNYSGQTIFNILDEVKHYNLLEALNRMVK